MKDEIVFKGRETHQANRYDVYTADSQEQAIRFLRSQSILEERRYIIVETPEGNIGKDLIMIFREPSGDMIELGKRDPLPKLKQSMTHCGKCGHSVIPAKRHVAESRLSHEAILDLKVDGSGFLCRNCQTLWCSHCVLLDDETARCLICGQMLPVFAELEVRTERWFAGLD